MGLKLKLENLIYLSMSGSRNRQAGLNFERELVIRYNSFGYNSGEEEFLPLFRKLGTTRNLSRAMDAMKIDLTTEDPAKHRDFGLTIQAKNSTTAVSYPKLLSQMQEGVDMHGGIPIIYHKQTERIGKNFMGRGEYIIMHAKDFEVVFIKKETYKLAFNEVMTYFDSFSEEIQADLVKYLTALNL